MTVYREIVGMMLLNGRLVVQLSCGHAFAYKRTFFKNKHIYTNARGAQIWRCKKCEQEATR